MNINENSFRSSLVGGFNRKDVIDYIEQSAQAYETKNKDLLVKLDSANNHLKEAEQKLRDSTDRLETLQTLYDQQVSEMEGLKEDLSNQKEKTENINHTLIAREEDLRILNIERDSLNKKLTELRSALDEYEKSKLRVADIELEAYGRAKKIELEALAEADDAKMALAALFEDAERRYKATKEAATTDILRLTEEVDRIRKSISELPSYFDSVNFEIETLKAELLAPGPRNADYADEGAES